MLCVQGRPEAANHLAVYGVHSAGQHRALVFPQWPKQLTPLAKR